MKASHYKFNEYMITETIGGDVYWQAHHGFGSYREGRCFLRGDILFFGPPENEGLGYLFGDFIDNLKTLPLWTKTKHYCGNSNIFYCDSGDKVSENEMRSWAIDYQSTTNSHGNSGEDTIQSYGDTPIPKNAAGSYRLGSYEIIMSGDGLISWALPESNNNIKMGACLMIEDILFFEASNSRRRLDNARERHRARIGELPKWDMTRYYSHGVPNSDCAVKNTIKPPASRAHMLINSKMGPWARLASILSFWQAIITSETGARIFSLFIATAKFGVRVIKLAGSGLIKLLYFCLDKIMSIKINKGKN